jgi:hypothetical protein
MAIRTRTGNSVKTETVYKSKSDHARALFREGKTVAEVTRLIPEMGYAFAYGIAKRAGFAETAAHRKTTKLVSVVDGLVRVRTSAGIVIVHPDGKITRAKA